MKVKIIAFLILFSSTSFVTNGQYLLTQNNSDEESIANKKRAELHISSFRYIKSDSTYFYVENYNKNGQIISHQDSEYNPIKYDYNSFGKRTRAYEIFDNRIDTAWEAQYIGDTLLFKVLRDYDSKYTEELFFDSLEREIKISMKYRKSKHVDSTITTYFDKGSIEITYENGKPVSKISENKYLSKSSVEFFFNFITPDSMVHFLTWTTTFDLNGKETSRVQQFHDRDEKTEYITTYTDKGLVKSSLTKTNGIVKFETTNYYDTGERLIQSIYKEQDYYAVTDYLYNEINLESKATTTTFKKGKQPEIETYISTYEFYKDE